MSSGITLIGDVHGKTKEYIDIACQHEYTVQIGDMGFEYNHCKSLNPDNHVFIGGNHDNYDIIDSCPNYLGRFGNALLNGIPFFFVGGAFSIDKAHRIEGKSWWRKEELTHEECAKCMELYYQTLPRIVLSHDCPAVASQKLFNISDRTITRQLMGQMWARWRPEIWIFGHWHESNTKIISNTTFVCLAELETFELKKRLSWSKI
jgi:predicted phosphodiesterase